MVRCRLCLIPTSRPDTAFVDGVCSACINYSRRRMIDWPERKRRLEAVLEAGRNGSGFDCIVPSSGGKDSTAQVMTLLEMGAKPLVVTATTCMLTEIGRRNIDNLARHATTIEVTPNRRVRAKLNRLGLQQVGDISHPEHLAIFSIPFQMAAAHGIPLIFYGESPQQEYGCPAGAEEALTMTRRWVSEYGGLLGMRAADMIGQDGITEHDMRAYMLPNDGQLSDITAYFLGQFLPWDSHRNAAIAKAAGMVSERPSATAWWDHENLDNAMTGLHDHQCYRKYGYGRLASQLSVDIRNGRLDRDEAMTRLRHVDGAFPWRYAGVDVEDVCAHIGVTYDDLIGALDAFTEWSLFDHIEDNHPILKEWVEDDPDSEVNDGD
jgi:N-acetyl sugar amidotransferase